MSGQWSGGSQNRTWQQPGRRTRHLAGDAERGRRLFAELAHESFWCQRCGGTHELAEMSKCQDYAHRDAG